MKITFRVKHTATDDITVDIPEKYAKAFKFMEEVDGNISAEMDDAIDDGWNFVGEAIEKAHPDWFITGIEGLTEPDEPDDIDADLGFDPFAGEFLFDN